MPQDWKLIVYPQSKVNVFQHKELVAHLEKGQAMGDDYTHKKKRGEKGKKRGKKSG